MKLCQISKGLPAYYETVGRGFIPARVVSVTRNPDYSHIVTVTLKIRDSKYGRLAGYKGGEIVETSTLHAIPPAAMRRRKYVIYVRAFSIFVDGEAPSTFAGAVKRR
jgi:hypothetical protein